MPIPDFNELGLLPEGLHTATLDEIRQRFGRPTLSNRRYELFQGLRELLDELAGSQIVDHIIVNGSFVTEKQDPGDIDLIVALSAETGRTRSLAPYETHLLDPKRIGRKYGFDAKVVVEGSEAMRSALESFTDTREYEDARKGLLRVTP